MANSHFSPSGLVKAADLGIEQTFAERFIAALADARRVGTLGDCTWVSAGESISSGLQRVCGAPNFTLDTSHGPLYGTRGHRETLMFYGSRDVLLASGWITEDCLPVDTSRKGTRLASCVELFGAARMIKVVTAPRYGFNLYVEMAQDEKQRQDLERQKKKKEDEINTATESLRQLALQRLQSHHPQLSGEQIDARNRADAIARFQKTDAQFNVGDVCVLWFPDYDNHGERVEIVGGFDLYRFLDEDGDYVSGSGERVTYQYGYRVRRLGGKTSFCPPHRLRDENWNQRHIRLVSTQSNQKRKAA
jgi:hypothetical protein